MGGRGELVDGMAGLHVFEGSLIAGDLNELNEEEHGGPDKLEGDPDAEDDGPPVTEVEGT